MPLHLGHHLCADGIVGLDDGEAGRANVDAELSQHVADGAGAAVEETGIGKGHEGTVDGGGGGEVAGEDGVEHRSLLSGDDVGGDADSAVGAHAPEVEVVVVVAAPDTEVGPGLQHAGRGVEVAVGLLVAGDVGDLGEAQERIDGEIDARAPGHVVDDDGRAGALGDLAEVLDDAGLGRPQVVGRDREDGVDAGGLGTLGEGDGVAGVVRAGAGDNRAAVAELLLDLLPEAGLLVVAQEGCLAGGAGNDNSLVASADEGGGEAAGEDVVDLALGGVGGDHGGEESTDLGHDALRKVGAQSIAIGVGAAAAAGGAGSEGESKLAPWPEVLAEEAPLALIAVVGASISPVETVGRARELLVPKAGHLLTIVQQEGDVVRTNLQNGGKARGYSGPEARVEEASIVRTQLAARGVKWEHLSGKMAGNSNLFPGAKEIEIFWVQHELGAWCYWLPEVAGVVVSFCEVKQDIAVGLRLEAYWHRPTGGLAHVRFLGWWSELNAHSLWRRRRELELTFALRGVFDDQAQLIESHARVHFHEEGAGEHLKPEVSFITGSHLIEAMGVVRYHACEDVDTARGTLGIGEGTDVLGKPQPLHKGNQVGPIGLKDAPRPDIETLVELETPETLPHRGVAREEARTDAVGGGAEEEVEAGGLEAVLGDLDGGGRDDAEAFRLAQGLAGYDAGGQVPGLGPGRGRGGWRAPGRSGLLPLHVAGFAGHARYLRHAGRVYWCARR